MKKYVALLWCLIYGLSFAQDNSYMYKKQSTFDAYGSLVTKYTNLNSYDAFVVGGRGGIILDKTLNLGAGIYGLASIVPIDVTDGSNQIVGKDRLHFMYGGFEIEYMINHKNKIHYSIFTLIGLGTVSSRTNTANPENYYDHNRLNKFFFVVEPEFNVIWKLTKFLHVSLGLSYLQSFGANYEFIDDNALSGFNGILSIHLKGGQ